MDTKTLIAAVLGGVVFFLLGFLIWGFILMGIMEAHSNPACMRAEEDFSPLLMFVAQLLWGLAFAYIFNKANINTFQGGAISGGIIAILIGLSVDLGMYSYTTLNTSMTPMFINIPANAILGAIGGGVIAWWLGRK